MDALEAARQHAASLHAAAIGRGIDPWRPLALILGEVELAGLAAEPTDPAANQLDGALATFLADDGLILYGDGGTEFEQAFLIAHELGHALLGDRGGGCDIDPERPAEAAPVGEERIVEHGPRQRREAQMDLFAREYLLPRPWVRDLHLRDGLDAADIAERLGAPRNVVAQQLFDALLLPAVANGGEGKTKKSLNERQEKAARHRGKAYLLEAGPGTGKTQTLTARVADLLADAVDPRRILVLTFSNKAAGEMSDRIAGGHADAFAAMWIGTFHAFGLDVLHAFGDRLGLSRNPGLLDKTDAVAMLEDELPRLGLQYHRDMYDPTGIISDILAAISRAKDEVCDADDYSRLADRMLEKAESLARGEREAEIERAQRAREMAAVYRRYEEMKRERDLVDFGDLVMLPVKLFKADDEVAALYRGKYAHVLVDEYQDVNRASVRLLKALCPDGNGLWAVGDARQSIYRFRGASSHNMGLFGQDFPGAVGSDLVINYRSSEEIVSLFSHFAKSMTGPAGARESLRAERGPSGERPELRVVQDKPCVTPAIADAIGEHRAGGGRYRDHCVLVSGNDRLAEIGVQLESLGVPILFLGSLFERSEIKDLLSLLSLLSDPRGTGLVRTACMPEFAMALADVAAALERLGDAEPGRPEWLDTTGILAAVVSEPAISSLAALGRALSGFNLASHPWEVLSTLLLDRTRIAARIACSAETADRSAGMAIWQFMNFLRAQRGGGGPPILALLARVRRLLRLGDERDLRQLPAAAAGIDAVRLMTIHGSKGLEFPVVHVPGLNNDTMPKPPHLSRPKCPPPDGMIDGARGSVEEEFLESHKEEQDCLLYVAMSRAENRLLLYRCSHQTGGKTRKESPFVARLGDGLLQVPVTPSRPLPQDPSSRPVPVTVGKNVRWHAWQLDTYEKCPRRFLYLHILRVGGVVERSPYLRVHDAVRELCQTIVEAGGAPDESELERLAYAACDTPELSGHGYIDDFKRFAAALVRFFDASRRGLEPLPRPVLSIEVDGDRVEVTPDDVLLGPDGHLVRSVRTGHQRKTDLEKVAARTLLMAARDLFPDAAVQIVHLADETSTDIPFKAGQDVKDRKRVSGIISGIRSGAYRTKPSPRLCPNCPALFVCDALPDGALAKKI
jgi:superfamily I DNA/RNA helicase